MLEKICEILNIPIKEINELKSNLLILASDTANIDWLYNSLTIEEQSAICYLASALYMDEHYPEYFDDNDVFSE